MPGVVDCLLTGMSSGSVVVDYEVVISTNKAAKQISNPNSSFADYNINNLLTDSSSLIESVLQDEAFVNSVISNVATARAEKGKPVIAVMPSDPNKCGDIPGCPFVPTAAAATVDYVSLSDTDHVVLASIVSSSMGTTATTMGTEEVPIATEPSTTTVTVTITIEADARKSSEEDDEDIKASGASTYAAVGAGGAAVSTGLVVGFVARRRRRQQQQLQENTAEEEELFETVSLNK